MYKTSVEQWRVLDDVGHTADVLLLGGEGGGDGCLGLRQGDPGVGGLQRSAVIRTVTAHAHVVPDTGGACKRYIN